MGCAINGWMEDLITAQTVDGINLPIIDITNPRFALADAPDAVVALTRVYEVEEQRRAERTGFVNKLVLRLLAFRSKLLRALISNNDYLDGTSTYVLKLGADNLPPPFNSPLDKVLAKSPHIVAMRLRHQQCAKLLADVLVNELTGIPQAPSIFSTLLVARRLTA